MSSLPSSSAIRRYKYDVFLSFRGEDTRKRFTDHLYAALKGSGIVTFMDDARLEAGEEIGPELLKAIEESWCSIIVFSENYASSGWCLQEAAEIVKQKDERGHKVFPIFYDVDPSHLRKQKGKVGVAFAKHEETFKDDKLKTQMWRSALTQLANLKGWHLNNRHESEFIRDIVKKILAKLCQTYPVIRDDLIGISTRLEELHSKIEIGEDDARVIGICGMAGIGKTTLARAVYTQMLPHFDGKCFLADVREVSEKYGLVSLQKQLLSQILSEEGFNLFNVYDGNDMISRRLSLKKVLVVVDNVDNIQHLKCLVGRRDWFGPGSRIIVTTRDEHLLRSYNVDDVYYPTTLNDREALHLFSLKAFNSHTLPKMDDFIELSNLVVKLANGLPLALEVFGSFLCGRDAAQWRSAIERLKRDSNKEIHDRLRISFDGLEETDKNIFLDIACLFNGEDKNFVTKILDGCEFFPDIGIDTLIKKSLITIDEDDKLRMHDLLQLMGRKIVEQKSVDEPGKRDRLWDERDVYHVLTENTGTETIEGMVVDVKNYQVTPQVFKFWEQKKTSTLSACALLKMKRLRLLKVLNPSNLGKVKYLSKELRLLEWHGYPFKALPSSFQPHNLVALLLPYSCIEQLWKGNQLLEKLKFLNLKGSLNLVKTPAFTMTPNLESLILEGCTRLVDIHQSIESLRSLKVLNLRDCKSLTSLPIKNGIQSLEKLFLSGCSNFQQFPEIVGKMECLVDLYLDGTGIQDLPSSIGCFSRLVLLNLKDCKNLERLPSSMKELRCLKTLNLCGCPKVESLPEELQHLETLEELGLSETALRKPQPFIFQYKNLKVLSFNGCKEPPSELQPHMQRGSTSSMGLVLPPLSGLTCLSMLNLSYCNLCDGAIPGDISCLSSLKGLNLSGNNFIHLPATLSRLPKLEYLGLTDCKGLKSLPELPTNLDSVDIEGCDSLEAFVNPTIVYNSIAFSSIYGVNCYKLVENNNALTMLRKYLKAFANRRSEFNIFLPGSEIPDWFTQRREGCSIKIPLPPHIRKDSKWMGIALSVIFVARFNDDDSHYGFWCKACVISDGEPRGGDCSTSFRFGRQYWRYPMMKDHLWQSYWSREFLSMPDDDQYTEIEFLFGGGSTSVTPKFKKCGARLVYEKDLQDEEEIKDHVQGPTGNIGGALVKRKCHIYDYEQDEAATPSEFSVEERLH